MPSRPLVPTKEAPKPRAETQLRRHNSDSSALKSTKADMGKTADAACGDSGANGARGSCKSKPLAGTQVSMDKIPADLLKIMKVAV